MSFYDPDLGQNIMSVEEFVRQVAEDGFDLESNPDALSQHELDGCWSCLQRLVDDARLVALHADPDDDSEMAEFVRMIARRERVPQDLLGEMPTDWSVLVEAVQVSRAIEGRAAELLREFGPSFRM